MNSQVLYTECDEILLSGEAAGEVWNWSLLGVKRLEPGSSQILGGFCSAGGCFLALALYAMTYLQIFLMQARKVKVSLTRTYPC